MGKQEWIDQAADRPGAVVIRFGLHLTLRSGREAVFRLVVTALAVALGVGLLLATLASVHAVDAQNARNAWMNSGTPEATYYGFGWRVAGDRQWHSGESVGFRNTIVRWPKQHLTVVVLSNRNDPTPYDLAASIGRLFMEGTQQQAESR